MTESGLTATTQDATLASIIDKLEKISGLPVVDQNNQVLGVITRKVRFSCNTALCGALCKLELAQTIQLP